jgi:hypothetical protein
MIRVGTESEAVTHGSFSWGGVRFDIEPAKADVKKILGGTRD